ncbi:hypothetical protein [Methylorubrum extorquens]|uniref:hypothetical protein n=1 Tax=Methylorubrum extorquens TaxID=408 RepID=UPI0020A1870F|nr:hypothetical protein [Methylorubrum extorquens]
MKTKWVAAMGHEELLAKLEARQALIVHFSHRAAMRGDLVYPTDLHQVLAEREAWALSCSVLTPGHSMDVVGSVGVVLEPRTAEDVLRVHHDDAGAFEVGMESLSMGKALSDASFDESIDLVVPGSYNEWRVRGAAPKGLFVVNPAVIMVRQEISFEGPDGPMTTIGEVPISLDAVRATFPGWPIWTMTSAGPQVL